MTAPAAVYRPRNPQDSDFYRCVEDYFETFFGIYAEYFSRQYGFWRPFVEQVIRAILDHLGLWLARARPPPKINASSVCIHSTGKPAAPYIMDDVSQIPAHDDSFYGDPQYSWDDYIQA
jgi:hypothetical protein